MRAGGHRGRSGQQRRRTAVGRAGGLLRGHGRGVDADELLIAVEREVRGRGDVAAGVGGGVRRVEHGEEAVVQLGADVLRPLLRQEAIVEAQAGLAGRDGEVDSQHRRVVGVARRALEAVRGSAAELDRRVSALLGGRRRIAGGEDRERTALGPREARDRLVGHDRVRIARRRDVGEGRARDPGVVVQGLGERRGVAGGRDRRARRARQRRGRRAPQTRPTAHPAQRYFFFFFFGLTVSDFGAVTVRVFLVLMFFTEIEPRRTVNFVELQRSWVSQRVPRTVAAPWRPRVRKRPVPSPHSLRVLRPAATTRRCPPQRSLPFSVSWVIGVLPRVCVTLNWPW